MKRILNNGKVIVSLVSVLAILAVSLLSMFTGVTFMAAAEGEDAEATYPLSGSYDADYVEVLEPGIKYLDIDLSKKTKVNKFTAYDEYFCVYPETEGNGTAGAPYIIKTANQFAAVVTGNLKDANGNWMSTEGVYFKIADDIYGFDLNNTGSSFDFKSDSVTAAQVEAELKNATIASGREWQNKSGKPFMGRFDGNGACVYGLKSDAGYSAIFPKIGGNITVKNLTVKNCYFTGSAVSAFFGANTNPGKTSTFNTRHFMYNCQAYGNVLVCTYNTNEALQKCGILIGQTEYPTESNLVANDCLIYDNIAKHAENDDDNPNNRNITYGIVGNLHRAGSLTITSSIVLDSPFHAIYYGSNAHLTAQYYDLYTDGLGKTLNYRDVTSKADKYYDYVCLYTSNSSGNAHIKFNRYDQDGVNDVNGAKGYDHDTKGGKIYPTTADAIKSATALEGINPEKWTYNENGFPRPKIYYVREYSGGKAWSGEKAVQFGEGDGSSTAPYTVANAEEFALMLMDFTPGAYYKLVADIMINDTTAENWTDNAKTWFTSNDVPTFEASLDGNGHTVTGIYYDGSQAGEYAGLIPVVGNTAEIRGITVADSYIKANSGAAGAVIGAVADKCTKVVTIDASAAKDTVKFEGNAKFGGIVGKLGYSVTKFSDCISETNGLFNYVTGEAKLYRSISIGSYPFAEYKENAIKAENVYTDTEGTAVDGITVLANADMKGTAAQGNMPGLNFPTSWQATDGYPKATGAAASAEGIIGEPWTGAIATSYALAYEDPNNPGKAWVGDGSEEYPYIIETAEQLAYFVWKGEKGSVDNIIHIKLAADIYLSDIDSPLFAEKIGCTNWFTQRTTKTYNNIAGVDFDGDGYVIHGLFFDSTMSTADYYRASLFPMLGAYSTVRNVGLSNAYLVGRTGPEHQNTNTGDFIAGFVACIDDFDKFLGLDSHDAEGNMEKLRDPGNDYENMAVKLQNCFIDHRSYFSGYYTGGFMASPYSAPILENCIFTGAVGGHQDQYYTGILTGCDSTYGTQFRGCVVFPVTTYMNLMGGSGGSSWRSNSGYHVTSANPCYYFNLKPQYGAAYTKINNPNQRLGDEAKKSMPLLDWENTYRIVEDATPILRIFDKHRSEEEVNDENNKRVKFDAEYFSMKDFTPPNTVVTFSTGDTDLDKTIPAIVAPMFSTPFTLPTVTRPGYEFTGWYVWPDPAIPYDYGYQPARDITLHAGWIKKGVTQNFEEFPDSIWDCDGDYWVLNKPGAKGGYKVDYLRNGSKSMHYLGENTEPAACLLNYEEMLEPGKSYTITFWVNTDKESNPATLLSLVHNSKPDYLDSTVATENMAVVTGLTKGEWVQYSYSFTALTKWVSLQAAGGASLYFDDIVMAELDDTLEGGKFVGLGGSGAAGGALSPNTGEAVSVAVLISIIMACAVVAVISRKNLVEIVED